MRFLLPFLLLLCLTSCTDEEATLVQYVFYNGKIWTEAGCRQGETDYCATYITADADGKILEVGNEALTKADFASKSGVNENTIFTDLKGAFVSPGLIEGHAHFSGLGSSLRNLNFLRSKSWEEIVDMVAKRANELPAGAWVSGRGWHQEKWDEPHDHSVGGYPVHDELSRLTSEHPVILNHASGHALFANEVAMKMANVNKETPDPEGGRILRDVQGNPTGVFEERAMDLITDAYQDFLQKMKPEERKTEWLAGIRAAEEECLRKGITSFQDAGSTFKELEWYKALADADSLDVRLWAMVRHPYSKMVGKLDNFPLSGGKDFFYSGAIKTELDGALGSYGAWLIEDYFDNPGFTGQNTTKVETMDSIAQLCIKHKLQLCVHSIGDRANHETLNVMEKYIDTNNPDQDLRWRIEHAQHLAVADIPRFAELGVIASMQGIHCTSDALFAEKRLGTERARTGAYAWRSLLDAGAVVTNGTDAPVEDVDAIESYYASVTRRRVDRPDVVFFPEQKMSREEALVSYTAAPAYAAFEEDIKGKIAPGLYCDLTVFSNNLLSCSDDEVINTDILMTVIGGKIKYAR